MIHLTDEDNAMTPMITDWSERFYTQSTTFFYSSNWRSSRFENIQDYEHPEEYDYRTKRGKTMLTFFCTSSRYLNIYHD